jgi:sugar lactone lactonase YvrE
MLHLFRFVLGLAGLLLMISPSWAQSTAGYGDWQLHLPANHPIQLADAGDRVYVVAQNAFYFLDKNQNTTQLLSSRDGLSDVGVMAVAYDSVTRQTVLAYRNGNLDILRPNGSIRNLSDIVRKPIQGGKSVNRITIAGSKAYLSTNFGLVVVDLVKLEISDTYSTIGPGGALQPVNDAAVSGGYLFLATSTGVLRGSLTSNLLDYRSWTAYTLPGGPRRVTTIAAYAGQVYAGQDNDNLYKSAVSPTLSWVPMYGTYALQFQRIRTSIAGIIISDDNYGIRRLAPNGVVTTITPGLQGTAMYDAIRGRDGSYYIANNDNGNGSQEKGFQRIPPNGGAAETYLANGPATFRAFSILADARTNTVDVFSGAYSERYDPAGLRLGFYEYTNGQWTNFNPPNLTGTNSKLLGPVHGTRTPNGTLYVGANGGGLLEWKGPNEIRQFGQGIPAGSPLIGTFGFGNDRVEITDLAATPEGKVWVVNRHLAPGNSGLFLFDPAANTWQRIPYTIGLEALERIALDDNGYAWVSVSRKTDPTGAPLGIYAIDPSTTSPNPPRFFTTSSGLPDNQIYELAKDRRGYIWAATIKGVAVYNDASGPFLTNTGFTLPIVRRGEGAGFPVLFSEAVRCLAVDGADRKWFGTDNGLWLFSPDADEALLHFTTTNSPLPSNRIVDVKVNDKTGEVWVATDAGVVAYRGSATVTEGSPNCTAVFPNPVRSDFAGTVGITGLANNGLVKITDVAGHLVYSTTATGGAVTWNLKNPNGERVRSGVYLVLSSDADGKNGCVSKVAVLSK